MIATHYYTVYMTKAKPYVELVKIDFDRIPDKSIRITPSPLLLNLERNTGIGIDKFQSQFKVENWQRIIEFCKEHELLYPLAINATDSVISLLRNASLDSEGVIRSTRKLLIQTIDQVPNGIIESVLKNVITHEGYYATLREDEKYNNHPERWKSPLYGRVILSQSRSYNLWELQVDEDEVNQAKIDHAHLNNVYRRIWIHMDKDLMIELFEKVRLYLTERQPIVKEFIQELENELDASSPKRIHSVLVFSNLGERAATIKGKGTLTLQMPTGDIPLIINSHFNAKTYAAFTVDGDSSMLVDFYSEKTVPEIEEELPSLEDIYRDKALEFKVSLSRLTGSLEYKELAPTHKLIFGAE